jgi:hypothetical protein
LRADREQKDFRCESVARGRSRRLRFRKACAVSTSRPPAGSSCYWDCLSCCSGRRRISAIPSRGGDAARRRGRRNLRLLPYARRLRLRSGDFRQPRHSRGATRARPRRRSAPPCRIKTREMRAAETTTSLPRDVPPLCRSLAPISFTSSRYLWETTSRLRWIPSKITTLPSTFERARTR